MENQKCLMKIVFTRKCIAKPLNKTLTKHLTNTLALAQPKHTDFSVKHCSHVHTI